MAIKLSIEAFKVYLLGKPFQIQTDHRALVWLDQVKEKNARLTRWSLSLQPYDLLWYIVEGRIITMLMCYLDITAVTRMIPHQKFQ